MSEIRSRQKFCSQQQTDPMGAQPVWLEPNSFRGSALEVLLPDCPTALLSHAVTCCRMLSQCEGKSNLRKYSWYSSDLIQADIGPGRARSPMNILCHAQVGHGSSTGTSIIRWGVLSKAILRSCFTYVVPNGNATNRCNQHVHDLYFWDKHVKTCKNRWLYKGSLVRKLLTELRTMVRASIHTILSTTASCETLHQVDRKWNSPGACELTGERTLGRETLPFSGMVAPGVAETLFPRVRASIWESCLQKAQETVARARFPKKDTKKNWGDRSGPGFVRWSLHYWRWANMVRFGAMLLLCGIAAADC